VTAEEGGAEADSAAPRAEERPDPVTRPVVLPRTLVILLELAAAVVVVGGIRSASWLVGPVFLALVIVITVHPVHARLRSRGLPGWVATTLLVLVNALRAKGGCCATG